MTSIIDFLSTDPEPLPGWLSVWAETPDPADPGALLDAFLASRTVYYPGSGFDGQPVALFNAARAAHGFVYVDYGVSRADLIGEIRTDGFRGYEPVRRADLSPADFGAEATPPDPARMRSRPIGLLKGEPPYAFLQLFRRQDGIPEGHGAPFFAVLFLFADGHAAYEAIYLRREAARPPFAVILQDHGFGGNWAPFGDGGPLQGLAARSGRGPDHLLVAAGTRAWSGYAPCRDRSGAPLASAPGGMHGRMRALWGRG